MSKSFNLTRLEKLVRWTLVTDRAYNIKTLWTYVTTTCIFFQLPNLSYAISHLTNDTYDLVKIVIIVMPLSILAAGGSYFFYSFYLWKDGIRELTMLPASKAEKFAEDLTHRDYLGAILGLGIELSVIGDILIRDRRCLVFCLASVADILTLSLNQVRRTTVTASVTPANVPELQPRYEALRLNVASERLDAVTAAFAGISRGQADRLFAAEKVFVNGRTVADRSFRLKEGDVISVRGFGKAVYDGIDHETRKNRYQVRLRKLI